MKKTSNTKEYSLKIEHLCKNYDDICAVDDVSFETKHGEIIALLGPNGAGKSTLMNMIAGYLAPTNGNIFIENNNIATNDIITTDDQRYSLSEVISLIYNKRIKNDIDE